MTKVEGECVAAVHPKTGEILSASSGAAKARKILKGREGPPPFQKAVCRHLCKNDSMALNGFVCTLHTIWGTQSENCQDKSPEMKAKGPKISGNMSDNPNKLQVTCPHCGKVGTKLIMSRWHFDNCKLKPHN